MMFFQEVERIRELYAIVGSNDGGLSEKWVMAGILQNLQEITTKHLFVELRDAIDTEHIQGIVTTHLYDFRTGLPRGQTGIMLHMAEEGEKTEE